VGQGQEGGVAPAAVAKRLAETVGLEPGSSTVRRRTAALSPLCGAGGRPLRIVLVGEPLALGGVPMSVFQVQVSDPYVIRNAEHPRQPPQTAAGGLKATPTRRGGSQGA
jgi:hypothetical protein